MRTDNVTIRAAKPPEAAQLSQIAFRSKAHWGYPRELLDLWEDDLTVQPDECDGESIWVLESGEAIVGFGDLHVDGTKSLLDDLWIYPDHIGKGCGKQLFLLLRNLARQRGANRLMIVADPFAVGFYEHMGARVVGEILSATVPGRSLPKMMLDLTSPENTTINPE